MRAMYPSARNEDLAMQLLASVCARAPISALAIASRLGWTIVPDGMPSTVGPFRGARVGVPRDGGLLVWQERVALDIATMVLRRDGGQAQPAEADTRHVARAILMPWADFMRDLQRVGTDRARLRRLHPYASAALVTARIADVQAATARAPHLRLLGAAGAR
jgi:hypothetical protein